MIDGIASSTLDSGTNSSYNNKPLNNTAMCLHNVSEPLTAIKDIVCYKSLNESRVNPLIIKHGDPFTARINDIPCEGRICIDTNNDMIYCCTDAAVNGATAFDKFGYEYSWYIDNAVTELLINGVEPTKGVKTIYQDFPVTIGNTYTSKIDVDTEDKTIGKGLHTYAKLADVKEGTILVKCIIPKGSIYHEGTFNGAISYASNQLKYVKILNKPLNK